MTPQPDVLFIGHGAERSGPPILLLHLQRWLAANTELTMATLLGRGGPLVGDFEHQGPVRVVGGDTVLGQLGPRLLRRAGRQGWADRLELGRARISARPLGPPRLVYANTVAPQTAALVRSVLEDDTKLLVHVHELASTLRHRIRPEDLRWLLDRSDHIVAASAAVHHELVGHFAVDPGRITICFEFVEPVAPPTPDGRRQARASLGLGPESSVIAASGRLDWRKAPDLLAQSLWRVRRSRPDLDAQVLWIGAGGDDQWQLEHDLWSMGLADAFHLVGEQEDPGPWVRAADVFALSSREDAFPLACLEAAGAELPLVTFDTGGMVEFVEASGGGIVVDYPDVEAYAVALTELLGDPGRREELGRAAAERVAAHHTIDAGSGPIHDEIVTVLAAPDR